MTSRSLKYLVPSLRTAFTASLIEWKVLYPEAPVPFPTCTHRDVIDQEVLFMMDKNNIDDDGDGKIDERDEWRTNAKPGQSKHNKMPAEALDVAFLGADGKLKWDESLFEKFAELMKKYGVEWGGDWIRLGKAKRNDTPHFQI